MTEHGNFAHIFPLDDGKFRLTFIYTCPGGASFSSEIGDFSQWDIQEWLKGYLHPATNFETLSRSLESRSELNVAVGRMLMQTHFEDGILVKSPATIEDVCQWMGEYQEKYFGDSKIAVSIAPLKNRDLKATACFCPSYPQVGSIIVSSELMQFSSALRISLLHELIPANLFATGKHGPDNDHGERFKAEVKRLMNAGAYDALL
jgi:hypothetical protein